MNYRFLIGFSALLLFSCKEEKSKVFQRELVGKWEVFASEMNQKPNEFMQEGFFEFNSDLTVESNLFDDGKKHNYKVEEEKLKIDTETPFELNISKLESDTLILEGKMKIFHMKYYLKRQK
ncbi:MAG TPA: hypothetical protein PKD51_06195 [Saprospiraceae bacterium]|jgi:hypothetical protein|nr:hypothetical protein [Saprospiraceae bacterium]HMU02779.1 hypothetical protein [Saprospiraceae bacterium]